MFEPTLLITYVLACKVFSVVPGPGVTLVRANSLSNGVRAGFWTIFGTQIAMLSMVIVVAIGLQAVLQFVGEAFFIIKLIGAAYLIWIGWSMFTSRRGLSVKSVAASKSMWRCILEGALANWSNPKTLLFLSAFLPQFVQPDQPAFAQIMVLGLIVMAIATITDGVYAILAGTARSALTTGRLKVLNRIAGSILMAGGVWLALQRRG